jgi:hypothetical protein
MSPRCASLTWLLAAFVLAHSPREAMAAAFGPKVDYPVAANSRYVVTGDFNADGKLDLAVASLSAASILLGNGDGTFAPATPFATGSGAVCVATADLNHDGKLDLVTANQSAGTMSVLLGNGDGSFQPKIDIYVSLGSMPTAVAIGELTGDGDLDLAVTRSHDGTVYVFRGYGSGWFEVISGYYVGGARSVAIGDFDVDGRRDLVTSGGGVYVLLGNGNGQFGPSAGYDAGALPVHVAIGDLDSDGRLDLATANAYTNSPSAAVVLGVGDGDFGAATMFGPAADLKSVAIGDLNGDGHPDLALANYGSNSISVLIGNGDGTFQPAMDYVTGVRPNSVAVGDFNGDGRLDLVTASNASAGSVSVLLNDAGTVGIEGDRVPTGFELQLHPNPFHSRITLEAAMPRAASVRLDVFDLHGRRVRVLHDGDVVARHQTFSWDGLDSDGSVAPAGLYLIRLSGPGMVLTRKVLLVP